MTNRAEFITDFFQLGANEEIYMNVSGASPDLPLTVELLDRNAQTISGYTTKISTNGVRVPVVWPKPQSGGERRALKVRFPLGSQARVYAVYLAGPKSHSDRK